MAKDRRHTTRRAPAGSCVTRDCHHPRSDHHEGNGRCLTEGCGCTGFTEAYRPMPKTRTVKAKSKTMRKR